MIRILRFYLRAFLSKNIFRLFRLATTFLLLSALLIGPFSLARQPLLAKEASLREAESSFFQVTGTISGTVFKDSSFDGKLSSGELGVAGITITAYDAEGVIAATATSGADGGYTLSGLVDGVEYRIEFTAFPAFLAPASFGNDSQTSVFFAVSPAMGVDFGVQSGEEYCQNNPDVGVACYENGSSSQNGNAGFVSFNYDASGIPAQYNDNYSGSQNGPNPTSDASVQEMGAVWGSAYQRAAERMFNSALLKRHSGFGSMGVGGVYSIDYSDPARAVSSFDLQGITPANGGPAIDLGSVDRTEVDGAIASGAAGDRQLPKSNLEPSRDLDAYDKVGKMGFGAIDMDGDDKTLWLVNLNQRALISVDVSGPTDSLPGTVNQYHLDPAQSPNMPGAPSCNNGVYRIWAVTIYHGHGYLGGVCTGEDGGTRDDLMAYVHSFDPDDPTAGLTEEISFPLNYEREVIFSGGSRAANWRPWESSWANVKRNSFAQAALSSIAFADNGDMILGFVDRVAHQLGRENYIPKSGSTDTITGLAAGDIIHVCKDKHEWILEGAPGCAVQDDGNGAGERADDGPSGTGEFYYDDVYTFGTEQDHAQHPEITTGAVTVLPGSGEVMVTAFDPVHADGTQNYVYTQGTVRFDTTTGERTQGFLIVGNNDIVTFGKGSGLGDPELICAPAPIELGNRVWSDQNRNGLQDPGEPGIEGVRVKLYRSGFGPDGIAGTDDDSDELAVAVTDVNGQYYFVSRPNADPEVRDPLGVVDGTLSPILPNTAYEIRLDNDGDYEPGEVLDGLNLTEKDDASPSPGGSDLSDSDAVLVPDPIGSDPGTYPVISLTTGGPGANNHSYDFGFVPSVSVGNQVWFDTNNNGIVDQGEVGIANITMDLFRDANGNKTLDADEQTPFASVQTTADGFYLFAADGNGVALPPSNYFVGVAPSNFAPGGALAGYHSSGTSMSNAGTLQESAPDGPNTDADNDDNGATQNNGFYTNGVLSAVVSVFGNEPTGEVPTNDQSAPPGNTLGWIDPVPDYQSNVTVDFGFYTADLGDRIFEDPENNGIRDAGTVTINDVPVRLYSGDGTMEIPVGPDSTLGTADDAPGGVLSANLGNGDGQYVFSGLPAGEYVVCIDPPVGYVTSSGGGSDQASGPYEPAPDPDTTDANGNITNNDDNGSLAATGTCSGSIASLPAELIPGDARLPKPSDIDNSSGATFNRTVDFGLVRVIDQNKFSLGNRIWFDMGAGANGDNGLIDNDEGGVPGITVTVYSSVAAVLTELQTTKTDALGYYRFDNLDAGDYVVEVAKPAGYSASNGASLEANPNDDGDNNDNGVTDGATSVRSAVVTLGPGDDEPTGETDLASGGQGSPDLHANMTVDIGLILDDPLSLGNQVFNDRNNDGFFDPANEVGIDNVKVNLYIDLNGDDRVDSTESSVPYRSSTTGPFNGVSGFYLFTGLAPGNYRVELAPENFVAGGPLEDFLSSSGSVGQELGVYEPAGDVDEPDQDADTLDIGSRSFNEQGQTVIRSQDVTLQPGTEPVEVGSGRDSSGTDQDGISDEEELAEFNNDANTPDANANLVVDFGLYKPYSLGNRVWFDFDDSAKLDGAELGIADVAVSLYDAANTFVVSTTTDALGYYRFDYLLAGDYTVEVKIPDGLSSLYNAAAGAVPMVSSTDIGTSGTPDQNDDSDDNGTDLATTVGSVRSATVTLGDAASGDTEPTGETDVSPLLPPRTSDARSNLTVDFGFYEPVGLGSRQFDDAANLGSRYAGQRNGLDDGIVILYEDFNLDGEPDGPELERQTTINYGDYFFFNLRPGSYVVELIPPPDYISSSGKQGSPTEGPYEGANVPDPNNDINNDDNGNTRADGRIFSPPITLTSRGENTIGRNADPNSNNTLDFGVFRPLSLGNIVWNDQNNNGLLDAGEPGINDVLVNLYWDSNDDGVLSAAELSTAILTATTANDGQYLFTGLGRGNFVVELDKSNFIGNGPLVGFLSSDNADVGFVGDYEPAPDPNALEGPGGNPIDNDDNGSKIKSGAIQSKLIALSAEDEPTAEDPDNDPNTPDTNENLTVDFGLYRAYSLGNRVWHDLNNNGLIDTDEPGLAAVSVRLLSQDGATVLSETATDINGYYRFDNLRAGKYMVEVLASNFVTETADGSLRPLAGFLSSAPDEDDPNSDGDSNDNGIGTAPNPTKGIRSKVVMLETGGSEPEAESDLVAGDNPQGTVDTFANMSIDFGFYRPVVHVGNLVWHDANNNGKVDSNEKGIDGVTIEAYRTGTRPGIDPPAGSAVTAGGGLYRIDNLLPGKYILYIPTPPAAYPISSSGADVNDNAEDADDNGSQPISGAAVTSPITMLTLDDEITSEEGDTSADDASGDMTVDFGFYASPEPTVSVGNLVWADQNNDGIFDKDGGEPGIDNLLIQLYSAGQTPGIDPPLLSTRTTSSGHYTFTNLPAGDYIVYIPNPPAELPASCAPVDPSDNGEDSDNNGAQTIIGGAVSSPVTVLAVGAEPTNDADDADDGTDANHDLSIDFCFSLPDEPLTHIGNRVWRDADNNGINEPGEEGLDDVLVELYTADLTPGLDAPVANVRTAKGGFYRFDNLPAGDYLVHVPTPPIRLPASSTRTGTEDDGEDLNNNGAQLVIGGSATSPVISLAVGDEPTLEPEEGTADDASGDLTVDFGFYKPTEPLVGLGNFVWHDADNDGTVNGDEAGVDGVRVLLYTADQTPCTDAPVAVDLTSQGGIYGFDNLGEGSYLLCIPQPPAAYRASSTTTEREDNGTNNDDNGTQDGIDAPTISPVIVLEAAAEPATAIDGDDANHDQSVDFGFYEPSYFDLALRNTLATDQPAEVERDEPVCFTITVFNQGTQTATGITITDYLPDGLLLDDPAWTAAPGNTATRVISGPLAAGDSIAVDICTTINPDVPNGEYVNFAEISSHLDGNAAPVTDIDSTPDALQENDGTVIDNMIMQNRLRRPTVDEDDHDIARVNLVSGPTAIMLTSFSALLDKDSGGDTILVRWSTTAEINTWGFHIYSSNSNTNQAFATAKRQSQNLILGKGAGGGLYQTRIPYSVDLQADAEDVWFWLVETETSGRKNIYGPVRLRMDEHLLFIPLAAR